MFVAFLKTSRVVDRAMSVGLRALLRSPCRVHPHAPSIYLVCDRRFLFRGRAGCQELSRLELFGGKRGTRRQLRA